MTDSTFDDQELILIDNWPGSVNMQSAPYDWFTATASHHNVQVGTIGAEHFALGSKIDVHCPGNAGSAGWSTFIYLELAPVTDDPPTPAAKQVVVPVSATNIYKVTNDPDSCILHTGLPLAAVMLSVMSADAAGDQYRGWFWCGGVCPVDFVSDLAGTFACVNDVVPGPLMVSNLAADAIGFALFAGATTTSVIGMSLGTAD